MWKLKKVVILLMVIFTTFIFNCGVCSKVEAVTKTNPQILAITPVNVYTTNNKYPSLPSKVYAKFQTGISNYVPVSWNKINSSSLSKPGKITVYGSVSGTSLKAIVYVNIINVPNVYVRFGNTTLTEGQKQNFSIYTNTSGYVQYRAFVQKAGSNSSRELTKGYTQSKIGTKVITLNDNYIYTPGQYKITVLVKRAGVKGIYSSAQGDYDKMQTLTYNCAYIGKIASVKLSNNLMVEGEKQTFTIASNSSGKIQYRVYLSYNSGSYEELTKGYTKAQNASTSFSSDFSKKYKKGEYKALIYVKRASIKGINKGTLTDYDQYKEVKFTCYGITSITNPSIKTAKGIAPTLPNAISAKISNGKYKNFNVKWQSIDKRKYSIAGLLKVTGSISSISKSIIANVQVIDSPKFTSLNLEKSTLKVGENQTISVTSKSSQKVQYRIFIYSTSSNKWTELTNGYSNPMDGSEIFQYTTNYNFSRDKYRISVWVKSIESSGIYSTSLGRYDSSITSWFDCTSNGKTLVCLDAGHGGKDSGCVGVTGVMEKNITLAVTLKVGAILKKNNIDVLYTRTNDNPSWNSAIQMDSLSTRCKIANDEKANIFVAIHCNSADDAPKPNGIETYTYAFGTQSEKLARLIQSELLKATGAVDRKVKTDGLYVLHNTDMPSILTELGFLSNPSEEKKLNDPKYQDKCASAIAKAIIEYLN